MNSRHENRPLIRLGVTDLSFHHATAAVVRHVLQRLGYAVHVTYAAHEQNFQHLRAGSIDMLASAWLPYSHGVYLDAVNSAVAPRELGLHYQPYALWGVPDYVPASAVRCLQDLLKPDVAARMNKTIQGIGAGAGISRFSMRIMERYRLGDAGYVFRTGSQQACTDAFERLVAAHQWGVVPLWHPQFLHHRYSIRELDDPEGLLGAVDRAVLLAREDRLALMAPAHIQVLDNIRLSNAIVAQLDDAVSGSGMSLEAAASEWMEQHADTVAQWFTPVSN